MLRIVYREWLEERRRMGLEPMSSDAHIHIMALIERIEKKLGGFDTIHEAGKKLSEILERDKAKVDNGLEDYLIRAVMESLSVYPKTFIGIDHGYNGDYGAEVEGYYDGDKYVITKTTYIKPER